MNIEKKNSYENEDIKSSQDKDKQNADETNGMSVYEQLLPKNESKLMRYMRSMERRIGFMTPLVYSSIFMIFSVHFVALSWCGYYLTQERFFKWQTTLFLFVMSLLVGFGVGGGVHRLWSHRSYKATLPLKLILLFFFTLAGQNSVSQWVRNHRVHHKCSDTVADPHDSTRGLFFSHCGWLMMKRHPKVLEECAKIDISDIENDPLLRFHSKYYFLLLVFCFVVVSSVPVLFWDENWGMAVLSQCLLPFLYNLNLSWCVNSLAHKFGARPYNRHIKPVDNQLITFMTFGEGWHNYHHSFPWDYKSAELPNIYSTTYLLTFFASVGWAYDLKRSFFASFFSIVWTVVKLDKKVYM